jgi:large subunit ribosomal protein L23
MTAFNLFGKEEKKAKTKKAVSKKTDVKAGPKEETTAVAEKASSMTGLTKGVLKGFYISEKSALGASANQYSFLVADAANKSEIKKEVTKAYNVKVKSIKVINTADKRRDIGRHPGMKSGFKKAIVVLEKGFSIGEAKA